MLKPNQTIKVSWHSQNKEHYIDKGYVFTKYRDSFMVKAEDLSRSATAVVKVICDYCGEEYEMTWFHYREIQNKNQKCSCYNCRHKKRYENDLRERQLKLYEKALIACAEKEYILVSNAEDIKNNTSYISYICPIHGEQKMRINNLINGRECPYCNYDNASKRHRLSSDEAEQRIAHLKGRLLNKQDYTNRFERNLMIECAYCGTPFVTSLVLFTQHGGQMCPNCKDTESIGERQIRNYLESNNIAFEQEKWFSDCRDVKPLPFDFYLPDYNMLIEFDGKQHFSAQDGSGWFTQEAFEKTQERD